MELMGSEILEVFEITQDNAEAVLNFANSISISKQGKANLLLLSKGASDNSIAVWLADEVFMELLQEDIPLTISYIDKKRLREHLLNHSLNIYEYY